MQTGPQRGRQTIWAASIAIYLVLLILLALAPQPQEEDPVDAMLQLVISPRLAQPSGVLAAEEPGPVEIQPDMPAPAQAAPRTTAPLGEGSRKRAEELTAQLASDQPAMQALAEQGLLSLGHGVVPLLTAAQRSASDDVKPRIAAILAKFEREIPGYGLTIALSADKKTVKPGETVTLTTVITNTLAEPQNLYVGYSLTGIEFQSAKGFHVSSDPRHLGNTAQCLAGGFCGTGAGPIFTAIPPGESVKYQAQLTIGSGPVRGWTAPAGTGGLHYLSGMHLLQAPPGDMHRFIARHTVTTLDNHGPRHWQHGKIDPDARYWVGTLQSNGVDVRVVTN